MVWSRDAERGAVHRREPQPAVAERVPGFDGGVGAVVDAEHRAFGRGQLGGLRAHAAPDVEHHARAQPLPHLAVARGVEREERVGGRALHRALAGQSGHTSER